MTLPHEDNRRIATDTGVLMFALSEPETPARFQIVAELGSLPGEDDVIVTTRRRGEANEVFTFIRSGGVLRSVEAVREPHDFRARLAIGSQGHVQAFDVIFGAPRREDHHAHHHGPHGGLDV
ncbi:MAG: hypothetical protein B7Z42_10120 [Brevundimonas sp. 12-68-7]|nr:MAG: hypothetical protein B7Z42_10120 [Brevundimonas sp. 12-68-7]